MKESVIEVFQDTGPCKINVDEVVRTWDKKKDFISQWHEQYTLVGKDIKITISKAQAHEVIGKLNLIDEPSPIYKHARTWRIKIIQWPS